MDFIQLFVLSIVQGLTEFLPVSSSAHLILVPILSGWEDQGLAFDVAVHVGTLSAVVIYFRKELILMSHDWVQSIRTSRHTAESRLAWGVIIGTIPVGIVGLLFKDVIETSLRSPLVIATTTIIFGLVLWWADARGKRQRDEYTLSYKDIIIIGCAQALALIPGTSRSGITITAGLLLGLSRAGAARFSFLLSIPAILLPGLLKTLDLIKTTDSAVDWQTLFQGAFLSGVTAFLVIHFFLKLLEKTGMMPYVYYRLILGAFLFFTFL
jgi:undecaprenyl-diphosphatase